MRRVSLSYPGAPLASRNNDHGGLIGGYFTNEDAHEIQATPPIDLATGQILYNLQSSLGVYDIASTYREFAGFGDLHYHFTPAFEVADQ